MKINLVASGFDCTDVPVEFLKTTHPGAIRFLWYCGKILAKGASTSKTAQLQFEFIAQTIPKNDSVRTQSVQNGSFDVTKGFYLLTTNEFAMTNQKTQTQKLISRLHSRGQAFNGMNAQIHGVGFEI